MAQTPEIDASLFEGMYQRAMKPDAALAAELKAVGFDLARIENKYPIQVWRNALDVTRRRMYPGLPEEQGYRALGRKFIDGYFETIIGRVVAVPVSLLGIERIIPRIARSLRVPRPDIVIDPPVEEAKQRWRVKFHDAWARPGFYAGIMEGSGLRANNGKSVNVEVQNVTPQGFDLVITW